MAVAVAVAAAVIVTVAVDAVAVMVVVVVVVVVSVVVMMVVGGDKDGGFAPAAKFGFEMQSARCSAPAHRRGAAWPRRPQPCGTDGLCNCRPCR